jgi:hypothetical protein
LTAPVHADPGIHIAPFIAVSGLDFDESTLAKKGFERATARARRQARVVPLA